RTKKQIVISYIINLKLRTFQLLLTSASNIELVVSRMALLGRNRINSCQSILFSFSGSLLLGMSNKSTFALLSNANAIDSLSWSNASNELVDLCNDSFKLTNLTTLSIVKLGLELSTR